MASINPFFVHADKLTVESRKKLRPQATQTAAAALEERVLQPNDRSAHLKDMTDISTASVKYVALLNEYRIALGVWSEARALFSSETSAVFEAERDLDDLEGDIRWLYGNSALPAPQPAVPAVNGDRSRPCPPFPDSAIYSYAFASLIVQ